MGDMDIALFLIGLVTIIEINCLSHPSHPGNLPFRRHCGILAAVNGTERDMAAKRTIRQLTTGTHDFPS